jgi:hypothetical protein
MVMRPLAAKRRRLGDRCKGSQAIDSQSKVNAGWAEIDPLDHRLDDAGLLRREQLGPEGLEFNEGTADVIFADGLVGLLGRAPGLDDDLG